MTPKLLAMRTNKSDVSDEVFREELKEYRGRYYVTYQPADSRCRFAGVGLVFHEKRPDSQEIKQLMENELKLWVTPFPVPVMVSSFDSTESVIHLPDEQGGSHLMGYIELQTGTVVQRWGLFTNEEIPAALMTAEHLNRVYRDIPFRLRKDVREAAARKNRKLQTGFRIFRALIVFVAVFRVVIEIISSWLSWLGHFLQAISILTGASKVGKALGWLKESEAKKQEAEKKRKMEHYYYHCERDPMGFERLKLENFEREAAERTREEAAAIAGKSIEGNVVTHQTA